MDILRELQAASLLCLIRNMRRRLRHRQSFRDTASESIAPHSVSRFSGYGDVQFGGRGFVRQYGPASGVHLRSQTVKGAAKNRTAISSGRVVDHLSKRPKRNRWRQQASITGGSKALSSTKCSSIPSICMARSSTRIRSTHNVASCLGDGLGPT